MKVVKEGYPDFTAFDPQQKYCDPKSDPDNPRWYMLDIQYQRKTKRNITLALRPTHNWKAAPLVRKGNRLSIMPFTRGNYSAHP